MTSDDTEPVVDFVAFIRQLADDQDDEGEIATALRNAAEQLATQAAELERMRAAIEAYKQFPGYVSLADYEARNRELRDLMSLCRDYERNEACAVIAVSEHRLQQMTKYAARLKLKLAKALAVGGENG